MNTFTSRIRIAVLAIIVGVLGLASVAPAFAWNPQPDPPHAVAFNPQPDPPAKAYVSSARQADVMTATDAA